MLFKEADLARDIVKGSLRHLYDKYYWPHLKGCRKFKN